MANNAELIRQARNRAKERGHRIGKFLLSQVRTGHPPAAAKEAMVGICEYCGAPAAVAVSPLTGGPEMWGDALERDCPGEVFI